MAQSIRKAVAEDLPAVRRCARAAYQKYVERIGKEPAPMVADFASQIDLGQVYVMVEAGAVVGYAVFYFFGDGVHLENIAVHPRRAGCGLGGRLLAFVEDRARRDGANAVELYTNEKMFENLAMYAKLGYTEIDRRREGGFDRVFFRKTV